MKKFLALMLAVVMIVMAVPVNAKAALDGHQGDYVIVLDAGHGGHDNGASGNGVIEKDVNLSIALYLRDFLTQYDNITVYMTREDDTYLGLTDRVKYAESVGADFFISIHNNSAASSSACGSEVYYPNKNFKSELSTVGGELAQSIQDKLTAYGMYDRGTKTRTADSIEYKDGSKADYYAVIRESKQRGICGLIIEHAFVSNEDDAAILASDSGLKALAKSDSDGIVEYLESQVDEAAIPVISVSSYESDTILVSWDEIEGATGYVVYRSESKSSGYEKLGSTKETYMEDIVATNGKKYYYRVCSFKKIDGYKIYSQYSKPRYGYTLGKTTITGIKQNGEEGFMKISWNAVDGAQWYNIYRAEEDGEFELYEEYVNKTFYKDRGAEPGVSYRYKVAAGFDVRGEDNSGSRSPAYDAMCLSVPEIKTLMYTSKNNVKFAWYPVDGAAGYEIYRATSDVGDLELVYKADPEGKNYYIDRNVEVGGTYYYTMRAIQAADGDQPVTGSGDYSDTEVITSAEAPLLKSVKMSTTGSVGVKVKWETVQGASGYRILRSVSENKGYKVVGTVAATPDAATMTYTDTSYSSAGETVYYKIKTYYNLSDGTVSYSEASNVKDITLGYMIAGDTNTYVDQMVRFYKNSGRTYPADVYEDCGAPTIEDFCEIVYEEAEAEGIRAEVVFAQVCKETGYLQFGGDVSPEQCNFAGIGAVGGGVAGEFFVDVRTGIRAQVQHLKAYSTVEDLNGSCVDPRFEYVKRGTSPYVEWLGIQENPYGGGWAAAEGYGISLRDDYMYPMLGS